MKRKRGTLDLRGVLGTIAILSVLFAIGAAGAILFTRLRERPELLAQSPIAAAQPASPTPASKESPSPAKARSANPISAAGAADMMSGGGLQTQPAPKQVPAANPSVPPTHAQQNELKIPSQPPPASNALTLPTESMLDSSRSSKVTAYLKSHRLPFVTAQVYRDASGAPAFLMLSGKVATDFGKQDAETRTLGFLGTPNLALDNQIQVDPGVQTATNPAPRQAGTLKLPSVFKGCWELAIDQQDGPVRLFARCARRMRLYPGLRTILLSAHCERRFRADFFLVAPEARPVRQSGRPMVAGRGALDRRRGFDADAVSAASFRRRQRAAIFLDPRIDRRNPPALVHRRRRHDALRRPGVRTPGRPALVRSPAQRRIPAGRELSNGVVPILVRHPERRLPQ